MGTSRSPDETRAGYGPFGLSRDPRLRHLSTTAIAAWLLSLVACGFIVALLGFFLVESEPFLRSRGVELIGSPYWSYRHDRLGGLSMILGTLIVSMIGISIAGPIGILGGIGLSELTRPALRPWLKIMVELLAGVPSVVYGLLGILVLSEFVDFTGLGSRDSLLTAGLLLGIMVIPTVFTLTDDACHAVAQSYRDVARALGLTRTESILFGVLPSCRRGIAAALLLALGRALGETIAVFLVVGRSDNQWPGTGEWLEIIGRSGQTLTSKLGSTEVFIAYSDPQHWGAVVSLGLILLLTTALLTALGKVLMGTGGKM